MRPGWHTAIFVGPAGHLKTVDFHVDSSADGPQRARDQAYRYLQENLALYQFLGWQQPSMPMPRALDYVE